MNNLIRFQKEEIEKSIVERFEKIVNLYPQQIAIDTETREITYEVLNRKANQLAKEILNQCGLGQESILILAENEIDIASAILAILKAGKFYTILVPSFPKERLNLITDETQAQLIITNSQNIGLAQELANNNLKICNIDAVNPNLDSENFGLSISPESIASIVFTSGSTGKPNGIIYSHRFLLHRIYTNIKRNKIQVNECFLSIVNFSFAGWSANLLTSLLNAGTFISYDFKDLGILSLKDWLIKKKVTRLTLTSQVFQQFLDHIQEKIHFPSLRQITVATEKLYKKDVERFWDCVDGDCSLKHGYGSSETGGIAGISLKRNTPISKKVIPVGYASEDKEIKILDEQGKEVRVNEVGEIAVKSPYLSLGYWQNPKLTQKKFLPTPDGGDSRIYLTGDLGRLNSDGCLELLGRKDFMVKIRGFRVELGEIEANLREHPHIKQTVVTAKGDKPEDKKLIAYFIPTNTDNLNPRELREFLWEKLPYYMIPSAFVSLKSFPLTANGKIDLKALPEPDYQANINPEFIAPRTFIEKKLVSIWSEVLGIQKIGIKDNFFFLGGNSLLGTKVVFRINQKFAIQFLLKYLFEAPTIEQLAQRIDVLLWTISPTDESQQILREEGEI